ncbi:glycoside hydrolase domain-containing protein [Niallia sp. FSL W8-0635]|uniref:glycoside hydrolase domain-containing protein n=1 Tax=Niallia sp. FSL W8-0635 TaxID=2975337 RepID=UPI0030F68655
MTLGFDCATKLTEKMARDLKGAGFEYAARYLGESWKSFDKKEAEIIQKAGIKLISIFQKSANKLSYFTEKQGSMDGKDAEKWAKAVGQPEGTAIYFAVDCDMTGKQMSTIQSYFLAVKKQLPSYKVGIYGSYAVMYAMENYADYFWQTYAWSRGEVAPFIHMYQHENNIIIEGVNIDRNRVMQSPGHWGSETTKINKYTVQQELGAFMTATDAKVGNNQKGIVKPGTYSIFNTSQGMINVTKEEGKPGSWINPHQETVHIVSSGETLTKIAKTYSTTIQAIQAKNPQIKNINLIYAGQVIKI